MHSAVIVALALAVAVAPAVGQFLGPGGPGFGGPGFGGPGFGRFGGAGYALGYPRGGSGGPPALFGAVGGQVAPYPLSNTYAYSSPFYGGVGQGPDFIGAGFLPGPGRRRRSIRADRH